VNLKGKLSRPFMDIDASYSVLTLDFVKLHDKVKHVSGVIGMICSTETVSQWMDTMSQRVSVLEDFRITVGSKISMLSTPKDSFKDELNHTMEEVAELQALSVQTQGWMIPLRKFWKSF
jgi:hypothetical protein